MCACPGWKHVWKKRQTTPSTLFKPIGARNIRRSRILSRIPSTRFFVDVTAIFSPYSVRCNIMLSISDLRKGGVEVYRNLCSQGNIDKMYFHWLELRHTYIIYVYIYLSRCHLPRTTRTDEMIDICWNQRSLICFIFLHRFDSSSIAPVFCPPNDDNIKFLSRSLLLCSTRVGIGG